MVKQHFSRRVFDPSKKEDLVVYKNYIAEHSWGKTGCPFELEWPYLDIPTMLSNKIAAAAVAKV